MHMYKVFCGCVNLYLKQKATVKFRFLKPLRKKELGFNYQRVQKIGIRYQRLIREGYQSSISKLCLVFEVYKRSFLKNNFLIDKNKTDGNFLIVRTCNTCLMCNQQLSNILSCPCQTTWFHRLTRKHHVTAEASHVTQAPDRSCRMTCDLYTWLLIGQLYFPTKAMSTFERRASQSFKLEGHCKN